MISVTEALAHLFDLVEPLPEESVGLTEAAQRVLARDVSTTLTQPPFPASAMDGYAIAGGVPELGARFEVIGEAAAGHASDKTVGHGHAVRIFTGAVVPEGADRVIIQEDVSRDDDTITVTQEPGSGTHIRPAGGDFTPGSKIDAPKRLTPSDIALLAAMNVPKVPVAQKPEVAIIATGDELVMPGETPQPGQIIASNCFGLKALLEATGASVRLLPIARDNLGSLRTAFEMTKGSHLILTIGGASVGDHDLVADAAAEMGLKKSFYKVAMRPGKPLMAGKLGDCAMIGLPGNPVSAMVCGEIFVRPVIEKMLGLPPEPRRRMEARLAKPLPENGPREHYMRAEVIDRQATVFDRQDSSLLTVLSRANALVVRPPNDPARKKNETVTYIPI